MAKRYIENITIMADLNEHIELPREVVCLENSFNYSMATVDYWKDGDGNTVTVPPTNVIGDFIYEGTVIGYVHKIYCSVVVGDLDDNPQSVFPDEIDQFGLPKKDVNTADVPDVDDYQYFKAKTNRTTVEQYQLQQLTEGLASKIILARDINHTRNAVIEIEKYCKVLHDMIKDLEDRVEDLEDRMDDLEDMVVVDAENLGTGEEVYAGIEPIRRGIGNKLQFKTLVAGDGITLDSDSEEITITADIPPQQSGITMDNCGGGTFKADNFEVCDEYIKFTDYMGFKMMPTQNSESVMFVLGVGDGITQADKMVNAGRIFKGTRNLVIEMKTISGFSGIDIHGDTGSVAIYENDSSSHIDAIIGSGGGSAYEESIKIG